jgi:hypothetical protein
MRKLIALVVLLAAPAIFAADKHDHEAMLREFIAANSLHGPILEASQIKPTGVTRTFNITAQQFSFTVSPPSFQVDQGDTVVINLSVPESDAAPSGHGMLMETYVEGGQLNQVSPGGSATHSFVATTPGQFIFVCTQSSCGVGHSNMFGTFNVKPAANPAPTITSVVPSSGSTAGGTTVVITGANFSSDARVTFGGTQATINVSNSTSIIAIVPAHSAGAVNVVVTNSDNQSVTAAGGFTYVAPPAVAVTSISGTSAAVAGGTTVTIFGANLPTTGTATVTAGGASATNVRLTSSNFLVATLPAHAAGAVDVVVNVGGQNFTLANAVTYVAPSTKRRSTRH